MTSVTRKAASGRTRRGEAEGEIFRALDSLLADGARFTELGVQDIAEAAGVGRSTFYVNFADKTDLLIRWAQASTQELFSVAALWTGSDEREALEETLRGVIEQRRKHAPALRALSEVATYEPEVEQAWAQMVGSNVDLVRARIEQDTERGLVDPEVDAELTAAYVTWGVERMVGQHVDHGCGAQDERVAATIARAVWMAMYGRVD